MFQQPIHPLSTLAEHVHLPICLCSISSEYLELPETHGAVYLTCLDAQSIASPFGLEPDSSHLEGIPVSSQRVNGHCLVDPRRLRCRQLLKRLANDGDGPAEVALGDDERRREADDVAVRLLGL